MNSKTPLSLGLAGAGPRSGHARCVSRAGPEPFLRCLEALGGDSDPLYAMLL